MRDPFLPVLLACLLAPAAQAGYLADDDVDFMRALDPAPKLNSRAAIEDRAVSEGWQAKRTNGDCERANSEMHVSLTTFFAGVGGPLSQAEANRLMPFSENVKDDGEHFSRAVKNVWSRLRPYQQWKETISLCAGMDPPPGFSYPSGHATDSRIFARVLGEIFPERKTLFIQRADQVAEDRVIEGAHYATDVEAGKKLGDIIFAALMRKQQFREDLRKQK